jgi:hypothetical protein
LETAKIPSGTGDSLSKGLAVVSIDCDVVVVMGSWGDSVTTSEMIVK